VILFDLVGEDEHHPIYQELAISNGNRQYDFLKSLVDASIAVQRPFLSSHILKALNFHAITCLHTSAGEFRPCPVTVGTHSPPPHYRVEALMEDFVNMANRLWETTDDLVLAAWVLWRLNWIHPFINGNGRTARAACYFVLCLKANRWLPGSPILPELLVRERDRYVVALQQADAAGNLVPLHALLGELIDEQIGPAAPVPAAAATPP
jgi:hypothetical protein